MYLCVIMAVVSPQFYITSLDVDKNSMLISHLRHLYGYQGHGLSKTIMLVVSYSRLEVR